MQIDSHKLKQLRVERQWSQDQLADLTGLNLRTIQRLETGAKTSTESLRALAAVFEVPAESLLVQPPVAGHAVLAAMRDGLVRGLEFNGTTARSDFWWFVLAIVLLLALATAVGEVLGPLPLTIASLTVLLPWIAACTRRLRDSGLSPWWQLICLVPVAGLGVLLYLLSLPGREELGKKVPSVESS